MITDSDVLLIAQGNELVFRRFHSEFNPYLFNFGYQLLKDKELVEDFIQETFISFWDKKKNFNNILAVKSYFYVILKNKIFRYIRDVNIHQRILDKIEYSEEFEEQIIVTNEICYFVQNAIEKLPPQTKKVIELSMFDMTVEEIGKELNVSPNTVKSLKKNAYRILRGELKDLDLLISFFFFKILKFSREMRSEKRKVKSEKQRNVTFP